jgi:site-specific DNA-methyltransferase (adenine-specific)
LIPYHTDGNIALYDGDLRNVLPGLPEACADYVVTDPPYGLSFMGEGWDSAVPGPDYWRAIARVCKPGALLAAFGGTRTWHRLVCAIEDAGWEIRDTLMWLQGQGFPKSADVGKLIDKAKGAQREVIGDKLDRPGYHLHEGKGNGCYGGGNGLHAPGTDARLRAAQITAPATALAEAWTGWAFALKPAWEPIILAMKPLDGTIAHNAETWGVAGMNIDACRIGDNPGYKYNADRNGTTFHGKQGERIKQSAEKKGSQFIESTKGRWPANLLLDEKAAAQLDAQTGTLTSGKPSGTRKGTSGDSGIYGSDANRTGSVLTGFGDTGGASRFFYCAKATKKERGEDNDHPTVKPLALMDYLLTLLSTPTGGVVLDPFAGSGSTLVAAKRLGRECIGVELDVHNCDIAVSRLNTTSR